MKPFIYKFGLQQQYNDLRLKDGQTMYIITDTHKIYIGDQLYAAGGASSAIDPSNIDLSDYATKNYVTTAISNIVGDYIPIIAATPINANENKIPLITDIGTLKPSTYTLQGLIDYFIGAKGFLTKDDLTVLTQAEYDELQEINPNTIYMTTDTQKIYMGTRQHTSGTSELSRILFSQNSTATNVLNTSGNTNESSSSVISAGIEKEITAYSPLVFNTNDTSLIDFIIYGNGGSFNFTNYELINTGDITWVQGSINSSGVDYTRTDRIRSSFMTIPTSGDYLFNFSVNNNNNVNLKIVAFIYDSNDTFLYKIPASDWADSNGIFNLSNLQGGNKIKIIFAYSDYTTTIYPSIISSASLFKIGNSTNTSNLIINISNGIFSRDIELDIQSLANGEILQLSDFNINIPTYIGNNILTVGINPSPMVYIRYKE